MLALALAGAWLGLAVAPSFAQAQTAPQTDPAAQEEQPAPQPLPRLQQNRAGETADSAVGKAGRRLTREDAAEEIGIKPTARLATRIQNRVQNRIRNRIDRTYDPEANATDPFAVAEDQTRVSGTPR